MHDEIAQWGILRAAWAALMRRLRHRLMLAEVAVRPLPVDPPPADPVPGITIRMATRADLAAAARDLPGALGAEFVDAALARGDLCAAAFDGPHMVAYAWASFSTAPHDDELWVVVEPAHEYAYKSYTRPEYRGRRLVHHVSLCRDQVAVARGARYAVGYIETHNYASRRTYRRLGSRRVGYAGYLVWGGRRCPFRTPGVRACGFRFYRVDGARP